MCTRILIDAPSVVILLIKRDSIAQQKVPVQITSYVWSLYKPLLPKNPAQAGDLQVRKPKAHQLQPGALYAQDSTLDHKSDESSSENSFCLQLKIQHNQASIKNIPSPVHLITNLAYRLKPHHTRNVYLRARLDTCADINIMPASVYRLMFKDPELRKLDPSELEIGTYTTDTVKIVGSCRFYLVHPDSKKLLDVIFFVATNDGSMLLSCKTTLVFGLIQPRSRLDYLPPRSSLITSSVDHPKKTKSVKLSVHRFNQEVATQTPNTTIVKKQDVPKLITSKEQILTYIQMYLKELASFLVLHTASS